MEFGPILAARRDARSHSANDMKFLAEGAAKGTIPDYQLSAWLMAAYLNPLSDEETAHLTRAMAESGDRIDLTGLPKPWVDKHSTGGVGDKTTLILLPLLSACGLTMVKLSGRGLGITGGTVDKLGSVPGFRMDLSPAEMKAQAAAIGIAISGQSPDLAPADKVLYALRDVTETVGSIPLIVSSILSKKVAGGAETIVLDVKSGSGSFMQTGQEARALAKALSATAKQLGLNCRLAVTDMNQPLGAAVGNALEVEEARQILIEPDSLSVPSARARDLCLELAALTLEASQVTPDRDGGRDLAKRVLYSGDAARKAEAWFAAQGANFHGPLPTAAAQAEVTTNSHGWVSRVDAERVGRSVIHLGGGRQRKEDEIAPEVGVILHACVGMEVQKGGRLATVYARDPQSADAVVGRLRSAFNIAPFEVPADPLIQFVA